MSARNIFSKYGIYVVLVFLIVFFSIASDAFLSVDNFMNILRQVAVIGIVAVGMTFVILTAGIDLSIGAVIGVSAVLTAQLMVSGVHPVIAIIITLTAGVGIGFLNTYFIHEIKIPPLIVTLATMTVLRGVAYLITGGLPVYGFPKGFSAIGQGYVLGVPVPVIIMVVCFAIGYIVLEKTKFGRYVYGIGSNEEASRLSGVNIRKVKYITYCFCGFLSALAGIVLLSRVNSGQPIAGTGYELDVITGVVLGGVSMNGGEGRITGVITGIIIMGVLTNGMILLNISEYFQLVVKGSVLLAAVSFDYITKKRRVSIEHT
ncbi:Ribose import permease protein RbsC [Paenibacillus sp. CECT 9249]|uniref:ABC transporter permease n=1 Tax=Paenibacillus sp. CECT 9249 TaxID=2845385 RepID=UPI001E3F7BB7|nr:ABC transporter permease [Paenibacillus sp. CECT 9249]CAH0119235.1 Ribose import permease protein RbsC [Paenibacillus sp. CECT 9249]